MKYTLFFLSMLASSLTMAEYQVHFPLNGLTADSFQTPIDPADVCPTSFPAISYTAGYPRVRHNGGLYYDVQVSTTSGYGSISDFSTGQRFVQILQTTVTGVPYSNGALYAGTEQSWTVSPGQYLNVVLLPTTFDTQNGGVCSTGTPVVLVNKTYAQLNAE